MDSNAGAPTAVCGFCKMKPSPSAARSTPVPEIPTTPHPVSVRPTTPAPELVAEVAELPSIPIPSLESVPYIAMAPAVVPVIAVLSPATEELTESTLVGVELAVLVSEVVTSASLAWPSMKSPPVAAGAAWASGAPLNATVATVAAAAPTAAAPRKPRRLVARPCAAGAAALASATLSARASACGAASAAEVRVGRLLLERADRRLLLSDHGLLVGERGAHLRHLGYEGRDSWFFICHVRTPHLRR